VTTLLVGFDSAGTATNSGALVGTVCLSDGTFHGLGTPQSWTTARLSLSFSSGKPNRCRRRQSSCSTSRPSSRTRRGNGQSRILSGRRSASVTAGCSRPTQPGKKCLVRRHRYGPFLARFCGPSDPVGPIAHTRVFETYPVLAMIALGWMLPDSRAAGRLPKYNPKRKKTFSISGLEVRLRFSTSFS
jgi:hypothetical protein